jgi:PPM family protein phosphatase
MAIVNDSSAPLAKTVIENADAKTRPGLEVGNLSDVGCVREHNEDSFCYAEPPSDEDFARKGRLAVIADGMGGHRGGEVASGLAVETIRSTYFASEASGPEEALIEALNAAHHAIRHAASESVELDGMGTTCIATVIRGSELFYVHVGDSRLYLLRDSSISQLTQDHTVVNRLLQQGDITPEQAARHPARGTLTDALGSRDNLGAEAPDAPIPLQAGDMLLLCTDGLHDLVHDHDLADAAYSDSPAGACRKLVELAKSRGGPDNITVQILKFLGPS